MVLFYLQTSVVKTLVVYIKAAEIQAASPQPHKQHANSFTQDTEA